MDRPSVEAGVGLVIEHLFAILPGVRSVGCLWIPAFPLACEVALRPGLRSRPAVVTTADGIGVGVASSPARRQGVRPGQKIREALGHCPELIVLEARPGYYDRQMERILSALELAAPGVEPAQEGTAYVDLRGLRSTPQELVGCAPPVLQPRVGIGPNRFVARVAAGQAKSNGSFAIESSVVEALADHTVDVLPVPLEMRRRLRNLGLNTLGDIAALPRKKLLAQFGRDGARAFDLANGIDPTPLRPRPWRERAYGTFSFLDPLASREALLASARELLIRTLHQVVMNDKATRQLLLRAQTEAGVYWEKAITLKEPLSEYSQIWDRINQAITNAEMPGAIAELHLELGALTQRRGWQIEWMARRGPREERLEEGLRQLKTLYGHCPIGKVVEVEPWSRIPERRLALIDFDA